MKVEAGISLKSFNTFGIESKAGFFARISSEVDIAGIINKFSELPLLVLGGGSNILFTHDFDGLVLKNELDGIERVDENDTHVFLRAGAGVNWHSFVLHCIENGYGGIENLSLIPGNVGASPMQNIGAYGVEIKDSFHSLEAIELSSGRTKTFSREECKFGYRESVFKHGLKNQFLISRVVFRLTLKNHVFNTSYGAIPEELKKAGVSKPDLKSISDAVIRIRRSKLPDPAEIGNAGSFFKNPVIAEKDVERIKSTYPDVVSYPAETGFRKLAAGWLIEKAGWKGLRRGEAGVHKNQALVLVNYGSATGKEIFNLSCDIMDDVFNKFGVTLEREVNIY